MANRLNLNWKLEWSDERSAYVTDYLKVIPFKPDEEELEMMGKYILWGKDRETGLNGRQRGLVLETRAGTWDTKETDSLDALMETPGFNEASILQVGAVPLKTIKETFSRSDARKSAPPNVLSSLESLWRAIDQAELITSFYDLAHNKRTCPIRQPLLDRFSSEELEKLKERATHLSSYQYLKERHNLVEMRREQYTLRDSYVSPMLIQSEPSFTRYEPPMFGNEIRVKPFGIAYQHRYIDKKIFNEERFPKPDDFSEEELKEILERIWKKEPDLCQQLEFDFTNTDHLYKLFEIWSELCADAEDLRDGLSDDSNIREFLRVARTYKNLAKLEPIHQDILDLKIQKKSNQDIVDFINKKYSKNYKVNYISTLYCKKCLEAIAQAARDHMEVIENIFYPENFKTCKDCGETFLLNEKNFVKRHRSADGFSPRCKKCEKALRDRRK